MTLDLTKPFRRLAPSAEPEIDTQTGLATFIFNTEDVGRDGHIVRNAGIRVANYEANPTILFAHDDTQPPVGRATAVRIGSPASKVEIEFTPRDLYPFGATIGDLVKARYLNACSMSWQPLKWRFRDAKDALGGGGVIFDEVDLLEISIVPVPALPEAIATARSQGIDTRPLYEWAERLLDRGGMVPVARDELESLRRAAKMPRRSTEPRWKCAAAKDLAVEDDDSWDGAAAEKSIFEWAGGDEFDSSKARRAFLAYDASAPDERGSYKLPIAHVIDGELKVPKGAIRAAASRLTQTEIPDGVKASARKVLDHYEEKAGMADDSEKRALRAKHDRALKRAPAVPTFRRGLYDVAQLACMLEQLGYCHSSSEYEAALEGDESPVPGMIGEALVKFGEALIAMTEEEVKELLESVDGGDEESEETVAETRSLSSEDRAHIAAGVTVRSRAWRSGIAVARAGRALSASNEKQLEEAHGHHDRAMKHHRAMAEHHEALGKHIDAAQDGHERAMQSLVELGEYARAAQENPEEAPEHLKRCMRAHGAATKHMGAVAEAHGKADESHEDAGDSHQALGRSLKRAQSCVRAVIDGAHSSEPDSSADEALEKDEAAKERAARIRRARALQLRSTSVS